MTDIELAHLRKRGDRLHIVVMQSMARIDAQAHLVTESNRLLDLAEFGFPVRRTTRIGKMTGKNGQYSGTLTDLAAGKTYKGKGWMSGNKLKMRGYSGIFFSTQTWSRR